MGEYYEVGDDDRASGAGPRRWRSGAVALGVAFVLAAGGVLAVRGATDIGRRGAPIPEPSPSLTTTGPDVLGLSGFGPITLGQRLVDFRRAVCGGLCTGTQAYEPYEIAQDDANNCRLHSVYATPDFRELMISVWVVERVVVSVSITGTGEGSRADTWLGLAIGDPLAVADPRLLAWEWDAAVPVPVARHAQDGRVMTLADLDDDGTVDYAAVATEQGDACELPPGLLDDMWPPAGDAGGTIDGAMVAGVSLGMPAADALALPGWAEDTEAAATSCRTMMSTGEGGYGLAYIRDAVIGITSDSVVGGPQTGQRPEEALASISEADRTPDLVETLVAADGSATVRGVSAAGLPVRLDFYDTQRVVAGIDQIVPFGGGARLVQITVGKDCSEPYP